jgi:thiol-disulfide isomerase/thioredoxin
MRFAFCLWLSCAIVVSTSAGDAPRLERNEARPALDKMIGKPAPGINGTNWLNSGALKLEELKGKVVVLEFWGTWCTTCIGLIPHHNELAKKFQKKGLVFIGICDADGSAKMPEVAKRYRIEYPIAVDVKNATSEAYKADSTPDFYLIDRKGNLRWADIVTDDVDSAIELLLAEPND